MKLLSLKYKMHKLVNLIFYSIIFGIGFIFGLTINSVNAEELNNLDSNIVCRDSKNLFDSDSPYGHSITWTGNGYTHYYSSDTSWTGISWRIPAKKGDTFTYSVVSKPSNCMLYIHELDSSGETLRTIADYSADFIKTFTIENDNTTYLNITYQNHGSVNNGLFEGMQLEKGSTSTPYEPFGSQICEEILPPNNNSFYGFAQKIFGEVSEENKFVYDFITFGLVSTCFILFVLVVGYIFKKFFGG